MFIWNPSKLQMDLFWQRNLWGNVKSSDSVLVNSILVIPRPFWNSPEFHEMEITILADNTTKIPFYGIPRIDRISVV